MIADFLSKVAKRGFLGRRVPRTTIGPAVWTRRARIKVRCFYEWNDFGEALKYLTPGGEGIVKDVEFVDGDAQDADWTCILNHPPTRLRLKTSPNRVIFAIGEPPLPDYRKFHLGQVDGAYVLTCHEEFCRQPPADRNFILTPCMIRTWWVHRSDEDLRRISVADKTRSLSWVTSNKDFLKGHRRRLAFLERVRGELDFDLYGHGFTPIADKWDALAPYRYSIAFENSRSPYYFTEKLMDCFLAETMPLYFGTAQIDRFFPKDAVVAIDPDDPEIVAKIQDVVRSDLWLRNKDAIREAKQAVLEKYNIFTRLANFILEHDGPPDPAKRMIIRPLSRDKRAQREYG